MFFRLGRLAARRSDSRRHPRRDRARSSRSAVPLRDRADGLREPWRCSSGAARIRRSHPRRRPRARGRALRVASRRRGHRCKHDRHHLPACSDPAGADSDPASLQRLRAYTETSIRLSHSVPGSEGSSPRRSPTVRGCKASCGAWQVVRSPPLRRRAPRPTSNPHASRPADGARAALGNRVPAPVPFLEVLSAAVAPGLLVHLALLDEVDSRRCSRTTSSSPPARHVRPGRPRAADHRPGDSAARPARLDGLPPAASVPEHRAVVASAPGPGSGVRSRPPRSAGARPGPRP